MQKHLFFWSGFFIAAIIGFQIALWSWGAAEQSLRSFGVAVFVSTSILTVLLVLVLFFRKKILRGIFSRTEGTLAEITYKLNRMILHMTKGEVEKSLNLSHEVSAEIVHYYAFSNFYRWIITSCFVLLGSFAGIAGTILLFEQNEKLESQTKIMSLQHENMAAQAEILALPMITQIRNRLDITVPVKGYSTILGILSKDNCDVKFTEKDNMISGSNRSQIASIKSLIENNFVGNRVVDALKFLVDDDQAHVAFTAAKILDQLELSGDEEKYLRIDNMLLKDLKLNGKYRISARNSILFRFQCDQCQLELINSVMTDSYVNYIRVIYNSLVSREDEGFSNTEITEPVEVDPEKEIVVNELDNSFFIGENFEFGDIADQKITDLKLYYNFFDASNDEPIPSKMFSGQYDESNGFCSFAKTAFEDNKFLSVNEKAN